MELFVKFTVNEMVRACNSGKLEELATIIKVPTEELIESPKKVEAPQKTAAMDDEAPETTEQSKKEDPKEQSSNPISLEDVRAAFMAKNSKTNASKLKAILGAHGVKKVTDLEEQDFASVIEELEAI